MKTSILLSLAAACLPLITAYTIPPPTTAPSDTIQDCTGWVVVSSTDTCASLAVENGITLAQFDDYNPSCNPTCNLIAGDSYCIEENFGIPPTTTTTSSTTTGASTTPTTLVTTTTSGNGVSTPSPIQTGMVTNCNKFYLVQQGDSCGTIAAQYSISLTQFYAWNPAVGSSCGSLWASDYVCVGIIGQATATTTTTTTPADGITTPTPYQTGMVSNCDEFYLVQQGDSCSAILSKYGISMATFYSWNPAVGSDCTSLWVSDYVCVGVIGQTTTTTTTGNGISTPTPIQSGMVSNCDEFYDVVSGDTCSAIASSYSIPLPSFYAWNPAVGSSCASLDIGYYVCVDIVGYTPTSTSTPTTTSPGNGITTPTPWEPGMVSNCDKFYYVNSGDNCDSIASSQGITVAELEAWNTQVGSSCSDLWLDTYICVGTL